uniref:DUF6451 domain-containing protein n=1 Tax=Octopus bimaculoides TaxID=37653 RepID=A0A0L8IA99_OCTBM
MEVLRLNTCEQEPIQIGTEALPETKLFVYLGSIISKIGGREEDVRFRIGKAWYAFNSLRLVWNPKAISLKTKLNILNSSIKAILLYRSETWTVTKAIKNKLQTFVNKYLHYSIKICWVDKISNGKRLPSSTARQVRAIT